MEKCLLNDYYDGRINKYESWTDENDYPDICGYTSFDLYVLNNPTSHITNIFVDNECKCYPEYIEVLCDSQGNCEEVSKRDWVNSVEIPLFTMEESA